MPNRPFIQAFDYIKLFGSIIIAFIHVVGFDYPFIGILDAVNLLPLYYIVSGFLVYVAMWSRKRPMRYVFSYAVKYALLYYVLSMIPITWFYTAAYLSHGRFLLKSYISDIVLLPLFEPSYLFSQLWFIPPLLFGIFVSGAVFRKKRERTLLLWILLLVVFVLCILMRISAIKTALPEMITSWSYFDRLCTVISQWSAAFLYSFIGMWLAKSLSENRESALIKNGAIRKDKLVYVTAFLLGITVVDIRLTLYGADSLLFVVYNTWADCIRLVLLFLLVLPMRDTFLKKHHDFVIIFSGVTYFFHILEDHIISIFIPQLRYPVIFIILIVNGLLSYGITMHIKHRKRKNNGL